jgi:hypothetical protein
MLVWSIRAGSDVSVDHNNIIIVRLKVIARCCWRGNVCVTLKDSQGQSRIVEDSQGQSRIVEDSQGQSRTLVSTVLDCDTVLRCDTYIECRFRVLDRQNDTSSDLHAQ